jgi:predicted KAP-like P-loop ATPase
MISVKEILDRLPDYIGKTDVESRRNFDTLMKQLEVATLTDEEQQMVNSFISNGLKDTSSRVDAIEKEMNVREETWRTASHNNHPVRMRAEHMSTAG